ncbi:Mitochondrial carrier family protein [Babesia bovis T2Bo]|uniref:Mitochondrial carrier family protein n=1 Tax=Babesia bovis T2Bo TaxID=484906 RepID=UPI001DFDC5B7|nr:Mitochondrial carrier family protein [Babesia bovis T2Bo]EDO07021.2 Mitochondrial carrier family protein [Babesia bovis T2Bo]
MININDRFDQLKQNLLKLNIKKKKKKRVGDTRMYLTQYLAHVLPLAGQRIVLAPIYRSCVAYQSANQALYTALKLSHVSPISILGGLYDTLGFKKLWNLSRIHLLPGAIFPGVLMFTKHMTGFTFYPQSNRLLDKGYLGTLMLCNFSHVFSYPFDVAYGRFASSLTTELSLRKYFYETYKLHGVGRLYSGFSLCLASTAVHLYASLSLNQHLQGKLKERLSHQIEKSPVYRSTIRPLEPSELKPIEMFPWNIIFGSTAAFMARSITYPLDTLRIRYQQESWHHKGRTTFNSMASSVYRNISGGIFKLYAGYPVRCALLIPECLIYGMIHYAVLQTAV